MKKNDEMLRTALNIRFTAAVVLDTLHTFKCDEHPWDHHNSALFTLLVVKRGLLFVANYYIQIDHFIKMSENQIRECTSEISYRSKEIVFRFLKDANMPRRPCLDSLDTICALIG